MSKGVEKFNEQLTELLIDKIKTIENDWSSPWLNEELSHPLNVNGRFYSGVNKLMLSWVTEKNGWGFPVFTTFKMAKDNDIQILKGSHGCPVVFFKSAYVDEDGNFLSSVDVKSMSAEELAECHTRPIRVSYTNVFNVEQTNMREARPDLWEELSEQYKMKLREVKDAGLREVDDLVSNQRWVCPIYTDQRAQGYFSPGDNEIHVAPREACVSDDRYYGVLFHEMTHSTGHRDVLGRHFGCDKWDPAYAREELVAELGSALTAAQYGLSKTLLEDNAAYLKGWLSALREDPEYLGTVLQDATKASKMICEHIDAPKKAISQAKRTSPAPDPLVREGFSVSRDDFTDREIVRMYYSEYMNTDLLPDKYKIEHGFETVDPTKWEVRYNDNGTISRILPADSANGIDREWYQNGFLERVERRVDGKRDGPVLHFAPNGQLGQFRWFENGMVNGVCRSWDEAGNLTARLVGENGVEPYKNEVKRFHLTRPEKLALSKYQPVKIKEGWLQLGMDCHARLFKDYPGNIKDEVNDLAQELAPALSKELEWRGQSPSKLVLVKSKAEEAQMLFGRDDESKESVRKGLGL